MKITITMDMNQFGRMSNLCVDGRLIDHDPIHFEDGVEYIKIALYGLLNDDMHEDT